jgi:hypothetical protein
MIWLVPDALGQHEVKYKYDDSGNRIQRNVIILPATRASATEHETIKDLEMPRYEDLLGERKVVIYPNPTRGMIMIEFQGYGEMNDARLLLYNMQGSLLQQVNNVESQTTLDLTPYPTGMYILHLIEGINRSEWKIIKQ